MIKKLRDNNKGFTLAELLIVVAIIAVLVAIAIPAFSSSLERAKYATFEANARSVHSAYMVKYMEAGSPQKNQQSLTTTIDGVEYKWTFVYGTGTATVVPSGNGWTEATAKKYEPTVVKGYVYSGVSTNDSITT